ncbi:MAG TPA: MarR family transcriptional regulator, partial [Deltaproteobacteria bacterium]|nr:MarR family transcriptional regulator [Deltaproteobacteria bacterium]
DTDGDGMPDGWEADYGLDSLDRADGDTDADSDGLSNREEFKRTTDPTDSDTDGDGALDGAEVSAGSDPLSL